MTRIGLVLTIVASTLAFTGGLPAGADKKNFLVGDWEVIALAKNGVVAGPDAVNAVFVRATATTFVAIDKLTNKELLNQKHTYEILNAKDINFYEFKSPPVPKNDPGIIPPPPIRIVKPGIYEFKDGTLRICFSQNVPGVKDTKGKILVEEQKKPRPTDFNGGIGQFSMTLKRKAK